MFLVPDKISSTATWRGPELRSVAEGSIARTPCRVANHIRPSRPFVAPGKYRPEQATALSPSSRPRITGLIVAQVPARYRCISFLLKRKIVVPEPHQINP